MAIGAIPATAEIEDENDDEDDDDSGGTNTVLNRYQGKPWAMLSFGALEFGHSENYLARPRGKAGRFGDGRG